MPDFQAHLTYRASSALREEDVERMFNQLEDLAPVIAVGEDPDTMQDMFSVMVSMATDKSMLKALEEMAMRVGNASPVVATLDKAEVMLTPDHMGEA